MAIYNFKNEREFFDFVTDKKILRMVGEGSEGICYRKGKYVVKILHTNYESPVFLMTREELPLESIIFPEDYYFVNGEIKGMKSEYVDKDILLNAYSTPDNLRVYKHEMVSALEPLINDIRTLSEAGIYMYDLAGNLLFDGNNYYVVDTNQYRLMDGMDPEELFDKNLSVLEYAFDLEIGVGFSDEKFAKYLINAVEKYRYGKAMTR